MSEQVLLTIALYVTAGAFAAGAVYTGEKTLWTMGGWTLFIAILRSL